VATITRFIGVRNFWEVLARVLRRLADGRYTIPARGEDEGPFSEQPASDSCRQGKVPCCCPSSSLRTFPLVPLGIVSVQSKIYACASSPCYIKQFDLFGCPILPSKFSPKGRHYLITGKYRITTFAGFIDRVIIM